MLTELLVDAPPGGASVPIFGVSSDTLADRLAELGDPARGFAGAIGFDAAAGSVAILPDAAGAISAVLFGCGDGDTDPLIAGKLAGALPQGVYSLAGGFQNPQLAALGFALGSYQFDRYGKPRKDAARLAVPAGTDGDELRLIVAAVYLARNVINKPANDMGPAELAAAVSGLANDHGADLTVTEGAELLDAGLPLIHTVGAAAAPGREPRLIDLIWGDSDAPKVTLVGKGVTFDTGGLDIKPAAGMRFMKKDMGGAANALALAAMIMGAGLPVRLRLLIPAAENAISSEAFRPGDVLKSRKGLTVEIGNTDAEGRLILADALALASEDTPSLLLDFATLTGAARVALGPDLPAIFTPDDALAADVAACAAAVADPLWRMPLWAPYSEMIESRIADLDNAGKGGFAGSITAALFLKRFVGDGLSWMHTDLFAWNPSAKPAGPEGGEAQSIRAIFEMLKRRFPSR